MKVKLLKEVGVHSVGTIIDVDATIVLLLTNNGIATIDLDFEPAKEFDLEAEVIALQLKAEEEAGQKEEVKEAAEVKPKK